MKNFWGMQGIAR